MTHLTHPIDSLLALTKNPENLPIIELRRRAFLAYTEILQGMTDAHKEDYEDNLKSDDPEEAFSDVEWFGMIATAQRMPWKQIHGAMIGMGYATAEDAVKAIDAAAEKRAAEKA
jgi:hypothetical protein